MSASGGRADVVQRALATAATAADLAAVRITELADPSSLSAASRLFDAVWGRDESARNILAPEALVALSHAGGQVSGAWRGDELIGATAAFLGLAEDGEVYLHSHVTGVRSGAAGRGVGRALKWHQRAWCLRRGIGRVRWTFDPLIRRNAVLNLQLLGARATAYEEDLYGRMHDARNAGEPTDRLVVDWDLVAPRVEAAASGRAAAPDLSALERSGAHPVLREDDDGSPHLTPSDAPRRLVQVPSDIERLRADDPSLAAAWGAAVRVALGDALRAGSRITGVTRDGWYVLAAERGVHELTHGGGS